MSSGGARRCSCFLERSIRVALPPRYQHASLDDFTQDFALYLRDWIGQSPIPSLMLIGPTGTGKTHAAAAIVRLGHEAKKPVLFKSASDFYAAARNGFNQPNTSTEDVMRLYGQCHMLVLDDLASGSLSDYERRCTQELLDMRLNHLRPTIVTTNWTLEQIKDRMDERIASRLSVFEVLALVGGDQRRKFGRRHSSSVSPARAGESLA
jgi:DNA replication protein DnaC